MDSKTTERWLAKLARLRVDWAKGDPAPHKPLLLLAIIELAERGALAERVLPLTPELAFEFCSYWHVVAYRRTQAPDVRFPFYHLQGDGCWKATGENGKPAPDRRLARFAELNPELEACLKNADFRDEARRILICKYFPKDEWSGLCTILGIPVPNEQEVARASKHQSPETASQMGREARFRLQIVPSYNYTCALTGYRISTISSSSLIDAAHIHQFSDSRNNNIRNGIALCRNAHWLFDNGLWTIADDFTVIVARGHFTEESPDQKPLSDYQGRKLRLPSDPALYPDLAHLDWHRRKKFLGSN
jgi:putative restriction endonuclease